MCSPSSVFDEHKLTEAFVRKVIDGIPKVAFAPIHDGRYEFTPYPSCLKSVMRHLGQKVDVDLTDIYRSTLAWIPTIISKPKVHEFHTGQMAYQTYIEKMLDDSEFPAGDMTILTERKMVHYDAMTMISERGGGAAFLRDVAAHPDFLAARQEITKAADAFEKAADQMGAWWDVTGKIWSDEEAQIRATADPEIRRAFVPYLRKSKQRDLEGARYIERALQLL